MLQNCIACLDLTLYFHDHSSRGGGGEGWEGRREHFLVSKGGHTHFFC
jgi:hypothetical protein